jgi:hypothetical protein
MNLRRTHINDRGKILWSGNVISVQPRIRLTRSFDQRSHSYLGYVLQVDGVAGEEKRTFTIGIGKGAHAKHRFRAGDVISGKSEAVRDTRTEAAEYYKASALKVIERNDGPAGPPPPWRGIPPELAIYCARGHGRTQRANVIANLTQLLSSLRTLWLAIGLGSS